MPSKYHIKNGTIVTVDSNLGVLYNSDVLISDNAITDVGPDLASKATPDHVVIDATNAIISLVPSPSGFPQSHGSHQQRLSPKYSPALVFVLECRHLHTLEPTHRPARERDGERFDAVLGDTIIVVETE